MAQAISLNMRRSLEDGSIDSTTAVPATLLQPTRLRIVQHAAPKLALQILLGVLLLCGILSWIFFRGANKLLYHNPCSFAGAASLLAGSDLLDDVLPPEAEWLGEKEMAKQGRFDRWLFKLGWTGEGDLRHYGVDADMCVEKNKADTGRKCNWRSKVQTGKKRTVYPDEKAGKRPRLNLAALARRG
jgi:hypothetical protein